MTHRSKSGNRFECLLIWQLQNSARERQNYWFWSGQSSYLNIWFAHTDQGANTSLHTGTAVRTASRSKLLLETFIIAPSLDVTHRCIGPAFCLVYTWIKADEFVILKPFNSFKMYTSENIETIYEFCKSRRKDGSQ